MSKRTEYIGIRVTPLQKSMIFSMAAERDMSVTEFLCHAACAVGFWEGLLNDK